MAPPRCYPLLCRTKHWLEAGCGGEVLHKERDWDYGSLTLQFSITRTSDGFWWSHMRPIGRKMSQWPLNRSHQGGREGLYCYPGSHSNALRCNILVWHGVRLDASLDLHIPVGGFAREQWWNIWAYLENKYLTRKAQMWRHDATRKESWIANHDANKGCQMGNWPKLSLFSGNTGVRIQDTPDFPTLPLLGIWKQVWPLWVEKTQFPG